MKTYPQYKYSGIDWMGKIPSHWKRLRLKDVSYMYSGLTGKSGDDFRCDNDAKTKPFVPFTNVLNNTRIDFNQFYQVVIEDGEEQNRVKENDLIFLMSSEDYESIAKSAVVVGDPGEVYLNSFCRGLHFTMKGIYAPFVNYQLNAEQYRDALRFEARGFTRINIKIDRVASQFIALPPYEEQKRIADYLDEKCGEIDGQVELLEKKRNAYARLRVSIINKAVTNGLNPNVTMRPSDIDWIGDIPAHWNIKRGKDFLTITSGYPADSELFTTDESKIPLVRIRDIQNTTTEIFYDGDYPEWAVISTGDLLIGMDGDFNVAMWKGDTALLNQRVCKLESETVDLKFVFYSIVFPLNNLNAKTNSTTVKHLSVMGIQNFFFAIPPFAEQRAISCYLDEKCCEIDAAIENIGKQIDAYKRLKKSLINEVVTGKRAV